MTAGDAEVGLPTDFYDAELRRHDEHLRAAAAVGASDQVLDVGCGAGQTTRRAARAAREGEALGVDVSAPMIERARRATADEGPGNVRFVPADAATHPFPPAGFDLCISRFGTMFFADPVAAFTNIGRALRPSGRLAMLVWQYRAANEWAIEIDRCLRPGPAAAQPDPGPAFSLADPAVTGGVLADAGFTGIGFADVDEPVFYGPDVDAAEAAVAYLWDVPGLLAGRDAETATRTTRRLRTMLADHDTGDGVWFASRAWLVTARRSP